jgi:solute carrier family 25 S-adenosylmethionine transporter 26
VVDFIVYPVDTLKTRIQSPNYSKVFKDVHTGTIKRNLLFKGLYQGVWSVVFSTIPSCAYHKIETYVPRPTLTNLAGAFFTTYETVKSTLYNSSRNESETSTLHSMNLPFTHTLPTPIMHGLASSTAEMVSCLILTPAEVLKQNAQMVQAGSSQHNSKSAMGQVLSRFKRHPWRLWSGYTALVGRNLPTTALQFPLFEYIRSRLTQKWRLRKGENRNAETQFDQVIERAGLTGISAAMSGTVAAAVTTPVDVVKTRVMLSADGKESKSRKGTFTIGRNILRDEGVSGLFKGGFIRAGWTAVALGLYLSLYEGGRFFLENRRKERDGVRGSEGPRDGEEVI